MRAQGASLTTIADELDICVATAWNWCARLKPHIDTIRAIELEAIQERILANYADELTDLTRDLERVNRELRERDLRGVSTQFLLSQKLAILSRLDKRRFPPVTGPLCTPRQLPPEAAAPEPAMLVPGHELKEIERT